MERRGTPERGGGRKADLHTHSSWVLLRDGEEEGVTCLQQEYNSLLLFQAAALPTVPVQESP